MIKRRTLSCLSLCVAIVLLLSGCSVGEKKTTGTSANGKVNLSIMWWGPQPRHTATLKVLDDYTQQNPKITFTPQYSAWDGYWTKLTTLAASNSMADVLQMDAAYIQDYASRGTLADLSDIDLSGIVDPKVLDRLKIDGKLYGIPMINNGSGMAFNKDAMTSADIPIPQKDWTWDDFFNFAKQARTKLPKGKYPITDSTGDWAWFQYYQASKGKGAIFEDGGKTFNLDKELWFEFQNIYATFRKNDIVPPAEVQQAFVENDPQQDALTSGKVMMRPATVASVGALYSLMPGKLDVINYPGGPSGAGWAEPTIFWSVSAHSKHKKEAEAFMKWFISNEEAGQTLNLTRGIPIDEKVFKKIEPTLKPEDKVAKKMLDVAMDHPLPFYTVPPGWTEWAKTYETEMEAVMFGQQSLEQAYKKIIAAAKSTGAKVSGN
ncbi:multiple sugar transport system substrate-binding protein [Pullulanibacillus pueri]|uniref:ABC transporter substrate-binding protein n=1 Tax=Pullulanibacillus pueri TaxID=1437324 RepID=A0A8J2ZT06_9BACL|nr:sugar ABC transporter substrate-binding protein [Pullulanibacillus pueri]MBM7681813.1 multiple sugar transport system substrate-binding protein [Pullulanibacillus pueri]GGH76188.1 ABC transporter substrate-binding protein [Pullulanibacillus pueri]